MCLFVSDEFKVKHFKKCLRSIPLKCGITFRWEFLAVRESSLFMWYSTSLCGDGFASQNLQMWLTEGKEKASDCIYCPEWPYGANTTLLQKNALSLQVSKPDRLDDGRLTQESIASPWSPEC